MNDINSSVILQDTQSAHAINPVRSELQEAAVRLDVKGAYFS